MAFQGGAGGGGALIGQLADQRQDLRVGDDQLLEPFPQLVEGASIDTVAAQCDRYVECTSVRNHKHLLTSRFTGEPVEVDNSVLDPRMQTRWKRNWYYPSPEMHEDAAANLLPALADLRPVRS